MPFVVYRNCCVCMAPCLKQAARFIIFKIKVVLLLLSLSLSPSVLKSVSLMRNTCKIELFSLLLSPKGHDSCGHGYETVALTNTKKRPNKEEKGRIIFSWISCQSSDISDNTHTTGIVVFVSVSRMVVCL